MLKFKFYINPANLQTATTKPFVALKVEQNIIPWYYKWFGYRRLVTCRINIEFKFRLGRSLEN